MNDTDLPEMGARKRLSPEGGRSNDAVVNFFANVIQIDSEALNLQQRVAEVSIHPFGYKALSELKKHEKEYLRLHRDLTQAREATITGRPYHFDRVEASWSSKNQNDFYDAEEKIVSQINATFDELERTQQLISSKQTQAANRTSLVISTSVLTVSAATLFVTAIASLANLSL